MRQHSSVEIEYLVPEARTHDKSTSEMTGSSISIIIKYRPNQFSYFLVILKHVVPRAQQK